MAEILFVTWDGGGNVPPALGTARELQGRGHEVRFLGHRSQGDDLARAGVEVVPTRRARPFSSHERHSPLGFVAAFGDRGMGRDLLDAVAERPADLVVVDCLMFGALDGARKAGLRYVVLEHFYDGYYERGCLRGPLGLSLRLRRLAPRAALAAASARLVTTLPDLDPLSGSASGLTYTGPVIEPAAVAAGRDEDPMVLVSLSTFAFPGMAASLQRIVDAAARLDARVVVTTGPAVDPGELRAAPGIEDGHTDQPMVGRSLEQAGAGRVVAKRATPDQLTPVLRAMLADGPHRAAAARLGAAIRALPGASAGADAVELLLRGGASAPGRPAARR